MGRRQNVNVPFSKKKSDDIDLNHFEKKKRFNIYIYDYCFKRGFRKTARELLSEAEIAPDATPPIDARQGLLFELVSTLSLVFFWLTLLSLGGGVFFGCFFKQNLVVDPMML